MYSSPLVESTCAQKTEILIENVLKEWKISKVQFVGKKR